MRESRGMIFQEVLTSKFSNQNVTFPDITVADKKRTPEAVLSPVADAADRVECDEEAPFSSEATNDEDVVELTKEVMNSSAAVEPRSGGSSQARCSNRGKRPPEFTVTGKRQEIENHKHV